MLHFILLLSLLVKVWRSPLVLDGKLTEPWVRLDGVNRGPKFMFVEGSRETSSEEVPWEPTLKSGKDFSYGPSKKVLLEGSGLGRPRGRTFSG